MSAPTHYVGLDLDLKSKQLTACIGTRPWKLLAGPNTFADSLAGFQRLVTWLQRQHCTTRATVLCMQSTGALGEPLAYYLALRGYRVALEPSIRIKRAFSAGRANGHDIGCREIAEYAARHSRLLHAWQPSEPVMQQIKVLLTDGRSHKRPVAKRSGAKPGNLHRANGGLVLLRGERTRAADAELRRLLMPQPTIAEEWPCY